MQENPRANLTPWLIGAGVLGAWWLLSGSSTSASAAPTLTPVPGSCPVDPKKFDAWLIEKQLAGNITNVSLPFPTSYDVLVATKLAPADLNFGVPFVLALGDGEFWYYKNKDSAPVKSQNLMNQYCAFAKSTGMAGHPADMFMI